MDIDELTPAGLAAQVLPAGSRLRVGTVAECVGSGAAGHVYRVLDDLGGPIAVREYFPEGLAVREDGLVFPLPQRDAGFEAGRKRFDEDGKHMATFDHPGLLKVQQVWSESGTSYQAMPWCEGRTLAEALACAAAPPGEQQLSDWLRALADALGPVHRQLGWHGHLSPSQLMLLDSGRLMVMEVSRTRRFLAPDARETERDPFAALECGSDARYGPPGPWTDIYALASIAHFALRGRAPQTPLRRLAYDAQEPLLEQVGGCSAALLHGLDCGLALRPRERPRDLPRFMSRMGLHERRSRPRSSGESLLINLELPQAAVDATDIPIEAVAEPQAEPVARASETWRATVPAEEDVIEAQPALEPAPAMQPPLPKADREAEREADREAAAVAEEQAPWPTHTPAAVEARVPPVRIEPAPQAAVLRDKRPRATAWFAGSAAAAAFAAVALIALNRLDDELLPMGRPSRAAPAATEAPATARVDPTPRSPIPEPLEPTAAGPGPAPVQPPEAANAAGPADAQRPEAPSAEPEPAGANAAVDAVPGPVRAAAAVPPTRAVERAPARAAERTAPAANRAAAAAATPPPTAPETATPASPCPGLLARQYIGRPLDAGERELLQAQCL